MTSMSDLMCSAVNRYGLRNVSRDFGESRNEDCVRWIDREDLDLFHVIRAKDFDWSNLNIRANRCDLDKRIFK